MARDGSLPAATHSHGTASSSNRSSDLFPNTFKAQLRPARRRHHSCPAIAFSPFVRSKTGRTISITYKRLPVQNMVEMALRFVHRVPGTRVIVARCRTKYFMSSSDAAAVPPDSVQVTMVEDFYLWAQHVGGRRSLQSI